MKKQVIETFTRAKYPTSSLYLPGETFTKAQFSLRFCTNVLHNNSLRYIDSEGGLSNMTDAYLSHLLSSGNVYNVGTKNNPLYRYRQGKELASYP